MEPWGVEEIMPPCFFQHMVEPVNVSWVLKEPVASIEFGGLEFHCLMAITVILA